MFLLVCVIVYLHVYNRGKERMAYQRNLYVLSSKDIFGNSGVLLSHLAKLAVNFPGELCPTPSP